MAGLNLFTNNAATTLASSILVGATSLTVTAGQGALFPTLAGSAYFYCTLSNTAGTTIEIVKVTARSTDTFTIVRAQDNTTASAFSAGDKVELRLTAIDLQNFPQLDSTNTFAQAQTFTSPIAIASGGTGASTLAGANIAVTNVANSFTAKQTFTGATASLASAFINATETSTISATAATGTINYDVTTQSVLYYTTSASANWTVNFRGNGTTSLNTLMSTNDSLTVVFLVSQGATAYYNNAITIDGTSVTPKYQGGTAWSSGNASGIDAYSYTIVKTGSAAFTVFAAQTQFK
jgi:hypothetical protein